jgi:hypothetical protein
MTRGHGGEIEDYLAPMREQGATVEDCLILLGRVEGVDADEAARILDASPSWADLRQASG